ncbi:ExbD/TolR family protein [Lentibacter sp. XHP0401]|uniref:ExbD/TolR family protein n=1 Tax=Lentibacter sp. XHP0401 TaxID=2984334 RepID=UPI0021E85AB9|nr:biopolymer transporter ExbD [Lentibacter sp. XHP0401]MCV2893569.1 biopolymer transporter ExbD [Lentibacter sp. XHP0401]
MAKSLRKSNLSSRREPTIALINIVFLMLIFFLIAGTIAAPLDGEIRLVETADLEGATPPDAIVLGPEGRLSFRSEEIDAASYVAGLPEAERTTIRLVPDRAAPAATLVRIGAELRAAGAGSVLIVTERALR